MTVTAAHQLCFIHIPKTAGMAMQRAIERVVDGPVFWAARPDHHKAWRQMSSAEKTKFRVIGGHIYATEFQEINRPKIYASLVREPVARAISLFNHWRGRDKTNQLYEELIKVDLLGALNIPGFRDVISDTQIKMLAGAEAPLLDISSNAQGMLDRLCDLFHWPRAVMGRENSAAAGYVDQYYTPEAAERIKALNRLDALLVDLVARASRTEKNYSAGTRGAVSAGFAAAWAALRGLR